MATEYRSPVLTINTMPKDVYTYLEKNNLLKDGEIYAVEGDDMVFDSEPKKGSENLISSGAIFDAFEDSEMKELSNLEIEELIKKIE